MPICPFCKKSELTIMEKYPKAAFDLLKSQYAVCPGCGYQARGEEFKKLVKG